MPYIQNSPLEQDAGLEPIAICGMGCRLPGNVDSPSSLWKLLLEKRSGNTDKVPNTRFNIDAHFHKNNERPGSFNVRGGYFIDGPAENFDPTYFNMTPVEAMWLDPQQRKMLEVCAEAIESAGLTLDSIAGTNTGVYVGSFTADYQQMTFKDPDFRHSYAATGVDPGIISNRIGNVFNLHGPSFTINTACSSSVYAIHHACHSLRARDCDAALVGGVNLILTVDQHMNTAKLGVLSPTSFCHTFDAAADGYGRGEGAGALYLKRYDDAVRDGDVIRAVIRSSAVNTNGKVPGYGITYPNVDGQERVIRTAYKKAGLNPDETAYFECHGTGTPVGDPIEVRAVSNAMNDTRSREKPLLIGAIKPNIGHSEAASGIFAVMKAALMVESGMIPGVAGLQTVNREIPETALNVKVNKDAIPWPKDFALKRASVSSFGYGGTNGHVIVDSATNIDPQYRHGSAKASAPYDNSSSRPLLITMSAHDKTTLSRNIKAHAAVADQYYLADLAHTLNQKRTRFPQRAFAVASEATVTSDLDTANMKFGPCAKPISELAFIFTGQGAQWAGVGRHAMSTFSVFRETIRKLDRILKGVEHPPDFTIEEALTAPAETSRINDANVAQPALVATQIAIVDLLASWNITPTATVGHSAGEYAAAYAAGLASAPEIIIAAYYRGYCLAKYAPSGGSMLAVGKGRDEVEPYLERLNGDLVIACENSPASVTLSGSSAAVQKAKSMFDDDNVFARELRTGMAYHSYQMNTVAEPMVELVAKALRKLDSYDRLWRCAPRVMISSVTNRRLSSKDINPKYWAANLTGRVLFDTAVTTLAKTPGLEGIGAMVEVGPHSALAGPFKQICQANQFQFSYIATLVRNQNGCHSLLKTAGELFLADYPVDLYQVNRLQLSRDGADSPKVREVKPLTLVDLPPYQWNYDKMFWAEPRVSAEYRQLTHARHDLLGSKIPGLSHHAMAWRNILRLKDVPWLQDHKLGGSIMFPAAAHMALAMEAARQHCEMNKIKVTGMTLRNVELTTALIIPEGDAGLEIQLRLIQHTTLESGPSFGFTVESYNNGDWTIHSKGYIVALIAPITRAQPHPVEENVLTQRHSGKTWNEAFRRVGFEYGPSFNALNNIRTHEKQYQATGEIPIVDKTNLMVDESRYLLHPSTVDCLLQLCIVSIHAGLYQDMPWGVVPIKFEEVTITVPDGAATKGNIGHAVAWNNVRDERARYFNTDGQLATVDGTVVIDIKGLHTVAYEAALPPAEKKTKALPYTGVNWMPDASLGGWDGLVDASTGDALAAVSNIIKLLNHKTSLSSVLVLDLNASLDVTRVLDALPATATLNIAHSESSVLGEKASEDPRVHSHSYAGDAADLATLAAEQQDLIIIAEKDAAFILESGDFQPLKESLGANGQAIYVVEDELALQTQEATSAIGLDGTLIRTPDKTLLVSFNATELRNQEKVTVVYSPNHSAPPQALVSAMTKQGLDVQLKGILDPTLGNEKFVLVDLSGSLLARADTDSFEALKTLIMSGNPITWLTSGVNEGKSTGGAMVAGFLRVIREEQKMSKVTVLDLDKNETFASVAKALDAIINHPRAEPEYWLHNGICHISRILPNTDVNSRMVVDASEAVDVCLPRGELLRGTFESGNLKLAQTRFDVPLAADKVEIQVEYSELRKQDQQANATEPRIVSGRVIQGKKSLLGKTVLAYVSNPLDTVVRVPQNNCVEYSGAEGQELVYLLPDLCRAENALQSVAELTSLQDIQILLLPTTPSLLEAFEQLSKARGINLRAVRDDVPDMSEMHKIASEAAPALVVIASEFSSLTEELWRNIPSGASLVLLNENKEGTLTSPLDVSPFNRGARFWITGIGATFSQNPAAAAGTIKSAMGAVREVQHQSVPVVDVESLANSSQLPANRCVVSWKYGEDMVRVIPQQFAMQFSSQDVYLLVGCLGGLGRSLTKWMMDRGARQFAFLSRSGADKPEAAQLIKSIADAGGVPQVYKGDASNLNDVAETVGAITAKYRIRGVVHAAMVLQDSMLPTMTVEKLRTSLGPKVDGAQALHHALKGHALDFFVMTSSISATVGQPGQSNYAAANSFLDNLALRRNLAGLPGTSLVLPMVLGVGVVAESDGLEDKISRRGMYGVDEREMLRGFEAAMSQPIPAPGEATHMNSVIIMGLEPTRLATALSAAGDNADIAWDQDARFAGLQPLIEAASGRQRGKNVSGASTDFAETVQSAAEKEGYEAALQLAASRIIHKCAGILMKAEDEFEVDGHSIGAYGLDSMVGAELRNWLFTEFGLNIAFQELLASTLTVRGLSDMVLERYDVAKQE
ncbi:lovastatin nonaketide synthase [Bimuria novae-zelandiae CBS 107.79]|uniref:Lovastatin nonaketide synthase n=1 Tax=Bimuria novae-zelandiae CBS 107.79 TaxID=1447943 RepID=A0A6A5VL99_9PLEO|nr:lovastatin nonaketide synthase [Bimuria novae-zelandiae CBS 107.79]